MSSIEAALIRLRHGAHLFRMNPGLFFRRVYAEARGPLFRRRGPVQKTIRGVVCEFDFRFDPSIKLMHEGIYEPEIVNIMRSCLRPGDTFIDVGANIGYLSAVALGLVGTSGAVHSFEPVPEFYARLRRIGLLNPSFSFAANHCALGESEGEATINVSNVSNIGWNTMVPGLMSGESVRETITVPVKPLSSYIRDTTPANIRLIKIDTEGYEFPVLKGLLPYFESTAHRPVLLVEIAPSAYRLLGASLRELSDYMKKSGYHAFEVHDHSSPVDISALSETTNVVFFPSNMEVQR